MTDYKIALLVPGGVEIDGTSLPRDVLATAVEVEHGPWQPLIMESGPLVPRWQRMNVTVTLRFPVNSGDHCTIIHDAATRQKNAIVEVVEPLPAEPVGIVRFLRDRFWEDVVRNWHLPYCQRFRPVPAEVRTALPALFGDDRGFSCDRELRSWLSQQYHSKMAVLTRHSSPHTIVVAADPAGSRTSVVNWCTECGSETCTGEGVQICAVCGYDDGCPTLRDLALPYMAHPQFHPDWAMR